MLGPTGSRLEHLRWWVLAPLLGLISAAFLLGPVVGLFVGVFLLSNIFEFGFALSRPVVKDSRMDRLWAVVVHGLSLAFIPLLVYTWYLDNHAEAVVAQRGFAPIHDYWIYPVVAIWCSATAAFVSAVHIVRVRAPRGSFRWHLRALAAAPVGALLAVATSGILWFLAPMVFFFPAYTLFGHALYRVVNPIVRIQESTPFGPPAASSTPTFRPFEVHGR